MTKERGGYSSKRNSKKRVKPSLKVAMDATHLETKSSKSLLFVSRLLSNMDWKTNGKGEEELEAELTLKDKMRAAHVKRWHIVRTMREQNIAEHSFVVMLIAMDILKRSGNDPDQRGAIHGELGYDTLRWAMWHDLMEIRTGDIATPTKRRIDSLAPDLLASIEAEFSPEYAKISADTTKTVRMVVKLADMIEAVAFISEEGVGSHAGEVREYLRESLADYLRKMPYSYYNVFGKAGEEIANELGIALETRK